MHHHVTGCIHTMIVFVHRQLPALASVRLIPLVALKFLDSAGGRFLFLAIIKGHIPFYQTITQEVEPRPTALISAQALLHGLDTDVNCLRCRGSPHPTMLLEGRAVLCVMVTDHRHRARVACRDTHDLARQVLDELAGHIDFPVAEEVPIMILCPCLPAKRVSEAPVNDPVARPEWRYLEAINDVYTRVPLLIDRSFSRGPQSQPIALVPYPCQRIEGCHILRGDSRVIFMAAVEHQGLPTVAAGF